VDPILVPALVLGQLWGPGLILLFVVILLFPDGELPSRLWRWALRAYCALYAVWLGALTVATADAIIGHPVHVDSSGGLAGVDHAAGWYKEIESLAGLLLLVLSLCFIGRQVLSWRRSSGERRQQLKWLASGAAFTVVCAVLSVSGSGTSATTPLQVAFGLAWFGFAAPPVSIGVGILKYRL
jgi:two-component system, NarL family, sensor kinase